LRKLLPFEAIVCISCADHEGAAAYEGLSHKDGVAEASWLRLINKHYLRTFNHSVEGFEIFTRLDLSPSLRVLMKPQSGVKWSSIDLSTLPTMKQKFLKPNR